MMGKKLALIIVPSLGGGGQERMAINTYNALKDWYDVKIVIFDSKTNEYKQDTDVLNINVPSGKGILMRVINQIKRSHTLLKLKKNLKPSVSYSIGNTANITNALSKHKEAVVTSIRNYDNVGNNWIDGFVYKRSDAVLCISSGIKKKFDKLFPKYENKSVVVYNGLDLPVIRSLSQAHTSFDDFDTRNYIVTMGRLNPVKGYQFLIPAFAHACSVLTDEKLLFIGKGEMEAELKDLAKEHGIQDRVVFLGFKNNPYEYLRDADAFVMSSLSEGFCNAIIEAMTCGLPIVSTNSFSGPQEILGNTDNREISDIEMTEFGILTPRFSGVGDEEHIRMLGDAIIQIVNDKQLNSKYRQISKKRAEEFSLSKYGENIRALFDRFN